MQNFWIDSICKYSAHSLLYKKNINDALPVHISANYCMTQADASLINAPDDEGNLPIHYVKDLELCQWMVKQDEALLRKQNKYGVPEKGAE